MDDLAVAIRNNESGAPELMVRASPGLIAPYASSALYDGITLPISGDLLAAVRAPYRDAFGAGLQRASQESGTGRFVDRMGDVIIGPPHLPWKPDCYTEYYLAPSDIGQPRGIDDVRALVKRAPRLIMLTNAGLLGEEDWRSGIVLDGRFLELDQSPWDETTQGHTYSKGNLSIKIERGKQWSEVSYGTWGLSELVVKNGSQTHRVPVVLQAWQCT